MGCHNGRAPYVSHCIEGLNTFQTAQDFRALENSDIDGDLALLAYTHFFDLDLGHDVDLELANSDDRTGETFPPDSDIQPLNFIPQGDFDFLDLNTFFQESPDLEEDDSSQIPPPVQTDLSVYPSPCLSGAEGPALTTTYPASREENAPSLSKSGSPGDTECLTAEEDKRRRNTAASARFRMKKKQNERAVEKSAKELRDRVEELQGRINQLETENKWLENLITQKRLEK